MARALNILSTLFFGLLLVLSTLQTVWAHPHIWIDVRTKVHFNDEGAITHLTHIFAFDKLTSAWAVEGLDNNADGRYSDQELVGLADANLSNLDEFSYYTFMGVGQPNVLFSHAQNARLSYLDEVLTLTFDLYLDTPLPTAGALADIEVIDPEYYIAFSFMEQDGVHLVNEPDNCETRVLVPQELDPEIAQRLLDLDTTVGQLPDELRIYTQEMTNRIDVNCTGGPFPAQDPLAAIDNAMEPTLPLSDERRQLATDPTIAQNFGTAFGFAPQETTIFGQNVPLLREIWYIQREFGDNLKNAFYGLGEGSNTVWVFLAICFGYGVFHAAGPGHGKAVVSSYVLANEKSLKRGIFLAFASALVQGVVAIMLIWGVSELFNFTFQDRQTATTWLERVSFGMIMILGGYLMYVKLSRLVAAIVPQMVVAGGHHNDHGHHHHHHDHVSCAHCGHDHMASPEILNNDFTFSKAVALIFSVGLRPCTGSMLVLIFAAQQGLVLVGALGVGLISIGTAITVSMIATLAVFAKNVALRLFGASKGHRSIISGMIELMGAVAIFMFGALLLAANLVGSGVI